MHIQRDMFGYSSIAALFGLPVGQSAQAAPAAGCPEQGDGESCHGSMSGSATNPIMQALAQALESLGLTLSGADASGASTSGSQSTSATGTTASGTSATGSGTSATASNAPAASGTTSPTTSGATTPAPATTSPARVDDDEAPHRVTYHSIARDIRHLMHALFQDIRAEALLAPAPSAGAAAPDTASVAASTSGTTTTAAPSGTSPFAAGLAALISQVSGGTVPANLQRAFDKLVADLQRLGGTTPAASTAAVTSGSAAAASGTSTSGSTSASGTGSTSTASAGAAAPPSLLLKFLTTLQADLGYGPAASTAGTTNGLLVNQVA